MGHRKQGQMIQFEAGVIVIGIIMLVVALIAGVFYLIGKLLWNIYLNVEAAQHAKAQMLGDVMEGASIMPLAQAVVILRSAGMYYDGNAKWRGKQFRLPKCFWRSTGYSFDALLKARTLVTIAKAAMDDERDNMSRRGIHDSMFEVFTSQIAGNLFESLALQARKTPTRVIAVVGLLTQQIAGNKNLLVFSKKLEIMGKYSV